MRSSLRRTPAAPTPRSELSLADPAPLPARPPSGRQAIVWPERDRWISHPGTGASPASVVAIYRAAEQGYLENQANLFDDLIENDGHLRSLIESRIAAVAGKDWVLQSGADDEPSKRAALLLEQALRDRDDFHAFLEHQLTAPYFGYACSEILWRAVDIPSAGAYPARFVTVPPQRFLLSEDGELRLITKGNETNGEALTPGGWVVSRMRHRNLARAGLMRTAAWWAVFKRMSVRDWVIFAQKFGIPHVTGRYQQHASDQAKEVLAAAIKDIGEGGQAVLSDATEIVISDIAQRAGDVGALHPSVVALCEAQMSKLINGATQNIETGTAGSYAQAKVHQARAFDLVQDDARRVAEVFRRDVAVPFVRFNGLAGARPPKLHIRVVQEMDPATRIDIASKFCNELGGELDRSQLMDELGFKLPSSPADALRGTKNATEGDEEAEADAA